MIKIKGFIEINGVVKAWLNIITGAVAVNSVRESPHYKNNLYYISIAAVLPLRGPLAYLSTAMQQHTH